VSLTGERTQESSFIAPSVDVDTELVFTFQVTDTSGQTAEDSCLITIKAIQDAPQVDAQTNADEASSVSDGGSRSSGGGPCFITTL
jgi:hypothetical protein